MGTNFIEGRIEGARFIFNGNSVELPEKFKLPGFGRIPKNIAVLGIKPEEILISREQIEDNLVIRVIDMDDPRSFIDTRPTPMPKRYGSKNKSKKNNRER